MWNILKKDLLLVVRDRAELLILICMPLILISILGFALGGVMQGNQSVPEIKVALVEEDQFNIGLNDFTQQLQSSDLPEEQIIAIEASAPLFNTAEMVVNLFDQLEEEEVMETVKMSQLEADQALASGEISGIITIPEGFTLANLENYFFNTGEGSVLELTIQEFGQVRATIIETIIKDFVQSLNFEVALNQVSNGTITTSTENVFGGQEYISTREPITAFQYYTIGMSVMFALYVASTISSHALLEKQTHVFDRLMLTGLSPLRYLIGKVSSTVVISMIQLSILMVVSTLVFRTFAGEDPIFWVGVAIISLVFSIAIGAIAALLTSVSLHFNSDSASGIFAGGIVTIFSFVGGSFTPVEQISSVIQSIGQWTPNGAAMSAYLQLLQGVNGVQIIPVLIRMAGGAVIIVGIALLFFPKRRSV